VSCITPLDFQHLPHHFTSVWRERRLRNTTPYSLLPPRSESPDCPPYSSTPPTPAGHPSPAAHARDFAVGGPRAQSPPSLRFCRSPRAYYLAHEDLSDEESGVLPRTPGPSRSARRHHRVEPVRLPRRRGIFLIPATLQRIRANYAPSLEGTLVPMEYAILGPVQVAPPRPWQCSWVGCGHTSARVAEAQRHVMTHYSIRWLCGNPQCPHLFTRPEAVKFHINESFCSTMLLSGTTADTGTPKVMVDSMDGHARRAERATLIRTKWV
jgi:hypothetical protein